MQLYMWDEIRNADFSSEHTKGFPKTSIADEASLKSFSDIGSASVGPPPGSNTKDTKELSIDST